MLQRIRVISDNDYAGDPDGLVQLAHLLLSPTVVVPGVIGSHLRDNGDWPIPEFSSAAAVEKAERVVSLTRPGTAVVAGSETPMPDLATPTASPAVDLILSEAARDSALPLYVVCGGGLTAIASAWLREPSIAERLTVVWIGGPEYVPVLGPDGLPVPFEAEYNSLADLNATRLIFNESNLRVWQVPRDVYRQTIASRAELEQRMVSTGQLGRYIWEQYQQVEDFLAGLGLPFGESYILGDSPLVLLTALQVGMDGEPATSRSRWQPRPRIGSDGTYQPNSAGVPIRVFESIDMRLMVEDFFAKLS